MNPASVKIYKKDHGLNCDDNMKSLPHDTRVERVSVSLRLSVFLYCIYVCDTVCVHSGKYATLLLTLLYPQATQQFADKYRPLLQLQSL